MMGSVDGTVYLSVYLVARPEALGQAGHPTRVTDAFIDAIRVGEWPYDVGDDPSFFCARRWGSHGGSLSWGICRRDLRNLLVRGDTVVFIGFERRGDGLVNYRFAGWATVENKVTQEEIWTQGDLALYREYLNLLVSPVGEGKFKHQETHPGDLHEDWLWRLTCSRGHAWRSKDFAPFQDPLGELTFQPGVDQAANGEEIDFCRNYVIFSSSTSETFLLAKPPVVALYDARWGVARPEQWLETPIARAAWELTLARKPGRSLRLVSATKTRVQQRHRHARLPASAGPSTEWREAARGMADSLGLEGLT